MGVKGVVLGGSLLTVAAFAVSNSQAQDIRREEASWNALTDEPSRGQLFGRYADALLKAEGGQAQTFAFPYSFHFARDALIDENNRNRSDLIFGIDISHWEGNSFPFSQLKRQSIGFVYTKATQGTDYADKTFDHNWNTLAALPDDQKIPRGAFHFLSSNPSMSGKAQADSFVDYVTKHGGFKPGDLRPALDLEWDVACKGCPDRWQTYQRTAAEIIKTTVDFITQVQMRTKRKPLIYTNKSFFRDNHIDSADFLRQLPAGVKVWIFDVDSRDRSLEIPNPATNLEHVLWQFSFAGVLPPGSGFDGSFDVDVFKGSAVDFNSMLVNEN
jgi:lysozyme